MKKCKELGDELWVIVNNDVQARLKTGKQELFQDEKFRCDVVSSIRYVDEVRLSIDHEPTIFETLKLVAREIRQKHGPDTKLIFGK
jgi:glycerol-3-phosphate cytidylyltransferase-like family protein